MAELGDFEDYHLSEQDYEQDSNQDYALTIGEGAKNDKHGKGKTIHLSTKKKDKKEKKNKKEEKKKKKKRGEKKR